MSRIKKGVFGGRPGKFLVTLIILGLSASCSNQGGVTTTQTVPADTPSAEMRSSRTTMAEGRVVPTQSALLAFTTPGQVVEVLVKEGDKVEKDQVLVILNGIEQVQAAIAAAEVETLTNKKALQDLIEKAEEDLASAEVALAQAQTGLKNSQENRERKEYQQASDATLDWMRANFLLSEDALQKAREDFEPYKEHLDNDLNKAHALARLSAAQLERDRNLYILNDALKKPDPNEVGEADAELALAKAVLASAELDYEKLKDGPDPVQLALAEAEVRNAEAQLAASKAQLLDFQLAAPFAGKVITNDFVVGELATPADRIAMADLSAWKIETIDLTELNVSNINTGTTAEVSFDAIPNLTLMGRVENLQAFGQERQGDITYKATIALDGNDPDLLWNMTAFVTFLPSAE
jgi:multidrug efflux pump subunit AcrA (membrane-fusion protein)